MDLISLDGENASMLSYNSSSNTWICGDQGGSLRGIAAQDGITNYEFTHEDAINVVAVSNDGGEVAVCVDRVMYIHENLESPDKPLQAVRTILPITHAAYLNENNTILVSSQEMGIQVYNCTTQKEETKLVTPVNTGVRTFATNQDDKFICMVDLNGAVHIHALQSTGKGVTYTILGSDKELTITNVADAGSIRQNQQGYEVSWMNHPSVLAVAVPGKGGCLSVFYRNGGVAAFRKDSTSYEWTEVMMLDLDQPILSYILYHASYNTL